MALVFTFPQTEMTGTREKKPVSHGCHQPGQHQEPDWPGPGDNEQQTFYRLDVDQVTNLGQLL